jgi:hypothetical protein
VFTDLSGHEIDWQKAADNLHVRSRMKIQLLGGESTTPRQSEWKQELISKMLAGSGS